MAVREATALLALLLTIGCAAERRCGVTIGCETQARYRPIIDDVSARVLAAAACKWKGDALIVGAATCERARTLLENLVRTDPDCASYQDAGTVLACP